MRSARHLRRLLGSFPKQNGHRAPDLSRLVGRPAPPPGNHWQLPPEEAERFFAYAPMEVVSIEPTAQGVAGALRGEVAFPPDGRRLKVKWKLAPRGTLDHWNNNPRREIACYAIQRWFLDPPDYVVPTIALRGVSLARYRRVDPKVKPTLDGVECVLGTIALWLDRTEVPHPLYDEERFLADHPYAYHLANLNVLAYLVDHRDGRPGNILAAADDANRRVFAVDNGIAFEPWIWNFLTTNWNAIRVPAIRRAVVDRLRALDRARLGALATLVEMEADAGGVFRLVDAGAPIDPRRGVRIGPDRVQLGLTAAEIAGVARRLATLLDGVDRGKIAVF